jgi:hypothetical protein
MLLVFESCRVPTCHNTPLVGLLDSILNGLLAAGRAAVLDAQAGYAPGEGAGARDGGHGKDAGVHGGRAVVVGDGVASPHSKR